jgi:hypothetical protein
MSPVTQMAGIYQGPDFSTQSTRSCTKITPSMSGRQIFFQRFE